MNCGTDDGLYAILEQFTRQKRLFSGIVYRMGGDKHTIPGRHLRVLHTLESIRDYISRCEYDMIILTRPDHTPMVWSGTDLSRVNSSEDLTSWIVKHWKSKLLIIAVS